MVNCRNLVIMCMDYRFQSYTHSWLKSQGFEGNCDVISIPGSSLGILSDIEYRTFVLNQVDFACKKHGVEKIIIFHHEDCGFMEDNPKDTSEQLKIHHQKMELAENILLNYFPDLVVEKYFISHEGVFYSGN